MPVYKSACIFKMKRTTAKQPYVDSAAHDADSALFEKRGQAPRYSRSGSSMPVDMADIDAAVAVLRRGGIILYPTDTVWGIGCDATDDDAVRRVYALKRRDDHKALITLVSDFAMLERTVDGIPEVAYDLIEFADRPTTIVYDRGVGVSSLLMGDDGTLGVRVTSEPFSQALVRRLGRPLVSTSANISGEPTPRLYNEIAQQVIDAVDYVCLSRRDETKTAAPSVVMRLSASGRFVVLRK